MSSDGPTKGMYGKVFMIDAGIYQKNNRHVTATILKIDPKKAYPASLIARNWVCLCKACVGFSKYDVVIGAVITVTSQIVVIYSEMYCNIRH